MGKYPVRVRLAGYEDWDGEVEVKENEFAELNVPLVRSTGTVTLTSEPAGLDFTLKGEVTRTGHTPAELNLPTGRYDITFSRPGWPEQVRSVEVRRNEPVQAAGDFAGGSIELTSTPSGAEVWSGGRQVGTTPYRVPEALPGRYNYELRLARHRPAAAALTVEARRTAREDVLLSANPLWVASKDAPYANSLGMKFVPVPGTNVLFSIWETREQDYAAFVRATGRSWRNASSGALHPAVNVTWEDAVAFCRWLTQEERQSGRLGPQESYRLPTDAEWSAAVGLSDEPGRTPEEKNEKVKNFYPWGDQWPPPGGAGNYASRLAVDSFNGTSPVGSFAANAHGLHDLGGNAWEWMQDEWRPGVDSVRVLRGASFGDDAQRNLLASRRAEFARSNVYPYAGFRVVLEPMLIYRSPDLQILGAQAVDGQGNTIITPGTQAKVTVRIHNRGDGKAEDVVVTLVRGENVFFIEDFSKTTLTRSLGTLSAGEHRDVEVEVLPNNRATAFALTASVTEASGRYSAPARDLGLVLNRASPGLVPVAPPAVVLGRQQPASPTVAETMTAAPETGRAYLIPELNLEILPIAPGTFQMGSVSGGDKDERPVTRVTITRPFWLGKTEVTQAQWQSMMGSNPSHFKGENLPVEQVSWSDAMEFCRKLTERERTAGRLPAGYVYTLPTEAQWEYACRAGTTGDYAGGLNAMGWHNQNSGSSTKTVGTKQANAWGLHDMYGNVWEWCLDWLGRYSGAAVADPRGRASGSLRVTRGGSWSNPAEVCRSAFRGGSNQGARIPSLGFRIALVPAP